jgi:DNA-binding NarL/FixJ family response regulator
MEPHAGFTKELRAYIFMNANVLLAGASLSEDWVLIRSLKVHHVVTLIESFDAARIVPDHLLESVALIAIDCTGRTGELRRILKSIKSLRNRLPGVIIVLIDGQLDQTQVIQAYRAGIRDYFRSPYDASLLAERIGTLCGSPSR